MMAGFLLVLGWAGVAAWIVGLAFAVLREDPANEIVGFLFMLVIAALWPVVLAWVVLIVAWEAIVAIVRCLRRLA